MSDHVAERVKAVRQRLGLSVKELAERCRKAGVPLTDQALYNIENGRRDKDGRRRRDLTVDELLALAYVLSVAPVHLLVEPDGSNDMVEEPYPVTREGAVPRFHVREWIRGLRALPGQDPRIFYSEVPVWEWDHHWVLIHKDAEQNPKRERAGYSGFGNHPSIPKGDDGQS